jgi:hypothetical protein
MRRVLGIAAALAAFAAVAPSLGHAAAPKTCWAMLVGVDQYAKIENLEFAGNDQRTLAAELGKLGFPPDQVFLLHDVAKEKRNLPFRENIERQLDLLIKMAGPEDVVVFAFSGHGVNLQGASYLCPTEADLERPAQTLIALDSIFDRLGSSKAALKLMLIDACRNDPRPKGSRGVRGDRSITSNFADSLAHSPTGLMLITSCSPGQISKEDTKLQHGVFMHFVLDGLRGKAANKDGGITPTSLYEYVSLATKKYVAQRWNEFQSPGFRGELTAPFELAHIDTSGRRSAENASSQEESMRTGLTGLWNGAFSYPPEGNRAPGDFSMILIQDGKEISGFIREANSFGKKGDPFLHASFRGTYNEDNLRIEFTKTYDGTASVDHDVKYTGRISGDASSVHDGKWVIPNSWGHEFVLNKEKGTKFGRFAGVWTGTNYYPEGSDQQPVKFSLIVVHKGSRLSGYIKERRIFGSGEDPWNHALISGSYDESTGELNFLKTYDGTAGLTGEVEYKGRISKDDASTLTGTWKADNDASGTFTLIKAPSSK